MPTTNNLMKTLNTEVKKVNASPWSLITPNRCAYDDKFAHSFRRNTSSATVKLYGPILKAVEMLKTTVRLADANAPDYIMVSKPATFTEPDGSIVRGKDYAVELLGSDGISTVFHKHGKTIRISSVDEDGVNNPVAEFENQSLYSLSALIMMGLPEILEADSKEASGKISDHINDLTAFMPDFAAWASADDIPELAQECAFYMDAIFCYLDDKANWNFASATTASTVEQIEDSALVGGFKGAVVVCSNPNVAFRYVQSNGKSDNGVVNVVTIAEAKAEFASFSSHRNWNAAEKVMIPTFPDDMPVMPETIRMARRIVGTRDAVNPVSNLMWRGVTAYGKSTGTRQLAAILNMPFFVQTCHPGMEITEFKSTWVPVSEDDSIELDMDNITITQSVELPPYVAKAVRHVEEMESEQRKNFLSGSAFYMTAMMDPDGAASDLFGEEVEMEPEELCAVYADTVAEFRERPMRVKLAALATEDKGESKQKDENKPGFKHIISPYLKAIINGYIVEIQEPSRIRDSGVLVGLNEYDHAGAVIHLMNGAIARRHKDALCIFSDNVGYASCRPIDPSVLRRMGMIIDSYELTEKMVKDRTRRNTGCKDEKLLDNCYKLWKTVKDFAEQNSITDGSVSPMELERFVQAMLLDGEDALDDNLNDCVISKATCDVDAQRDIRTACGLT